MRGIPDIDKELSLGEQGPPRLSDERINLIWRRCSETGDKASDFLIWTNDAGQSAIPLSNVNGQSGANCYSGSSHDAVWIGECNDCHKDPPRL